MNLLRKLTTLVVPAIAASILSLAAHGQAVGDFNDDGFADLAIGAPGENVSAALQAGVVHVIYGSANRLVAIGSQVWNLSGAQTGDRLGRSLTVGDFNGDGFDDLAAGMPGYKVAQDEGGGAVLILYGSEDGLVGEDSQIFTQNSEGVLGTGDANDAFGSSLAAGDFDNDGHDDLAIGVPGEDGEDGLDVGAVNVLFGSPDGLSGTGDQYFQQDSPGLNGVAEGGDSFGEALATGDFNGDGRDDLAVAVSNESFGGDDEAGVVHVLFGAANGLTGAGSQTWSQDVTGVPDIAEEDDNFGAALASGDFNNDGFDDLAIGVAEESVGAVSEAGAVLVLRGGASGLTAAGAKFITQNLGNVLDQSEQGDRFGNALAAGDFNNDGFDDLAVGIPNERVGNVVKAGAIAILRGSANGIVGGGNQFWNQNSNGILDQCEAEDAFGSSLAAGDFNNDGRADLAIGIPLENVGATDSGAVAVLYGSGQFLSKGPDQFWHQDVAGIDGSCSNQDFFGAANTD